MKEQEQSAGHESAGAIAGSLAEHAAGFGFEALLEGALEILPIIGVVLIVAFVVLGLLTVLSGSGEVLDAGSRLNLK